MADAGGWGVLEGGKKKKERWVVNLLTCVCEQVFPIYHRYLYKNCKKAYT